MNFAHLSGLTAVEIWTAMHTAVKSYVTSVRFAQTNNTATAVALSGRSILQLSYRDSKHRGGWLAISPASSTQHSNMRHIPCLE